MWPCVELDEFAWPASQQSIHKLFLPNFRRDTSQYLQECFLRSVSQSGAFAVDHNLQTLNSSSTQITCKSLPPPPPPPHHYLGKNCKIIPHPSFGHSSFLLPNPPSRHADHCSILNYHAIFCTSDEYLVLICLMVIQVFTHHLSNSKEIPLFADSNRPGPKKAHLS